MEKLKKNNTFFLLKKKVPYLELYFYCTFLPVVVKSLNFDDFLFQIWAGMQSEVQ